MNANRRSCPYCQRLFVPSAFRPHQRVCTREECQRRRRTDYHRHKRQTDPDYYQACLESQEKWRSQHPDYQRQYRQAHPASVLKNRKAQAVRDRKRRLQHLVKNNLALDLKRVPAEVWLMGPELEALVKNNVAISQVMIFQTVSGSWGEPQPS